jgi:small-conductance mechanosensitive channel
MHQKTLNKDFIKVDDENFDVVETRETTTNVNHKRVNIEMKTFRNNLKQDTSTILKNEAAIKVGCERYNQVIDDLQQAKDELKIDLIVPEKVDIELFKKEIMEEDAEIMKQKKEEAKEKEAKSPKKDLE